jgi:hypothetical protein
MDFRCESYALFKKGIKGNQSATWQVEVGPHGDGCTMRLLSKKKKKKIPSLTLPISSLLQISYL